MKLPMNFSFETVIENYNCVVKIIIVATIHIDEVTHEFFFYRKIIMVL